MTNTTKVYLWKDSPVSSTETPVDVTEYLAEKPNNKRFQVEVQANDFLFEEPITFKFTNFGQEFYKRISSGSDGYITEYNDQESTDYKYVSISVYRSPSWITKYHGKIVRWAANVDAANDIVTLETESPMNTLIDTWFNEVGDIYNGHNYTSSTRKTKTISGKVKDIIKKILVHCTGVDSSNVIFDSDSMYYSVAHQGHTYDLSHLYFIVQKWNRVEIETQTCASVIANFCVAFNAVCFTEWVNGTFKAYFRSKARVAVDHVIDSTKLCGGFDIQPSWRDYSPDGREIFGTVTYFDGTTRRTSLCGASYEYLIVAGQKNDTSFVVRTSPSGFVTGDIIKFDNHDQQYRVTGVASTTVSIFPPLKQAVEVYSTVAKIDKNAKEVKWPECFKLKLTYPDIYVACDNGMRKLYHDGQSTSITSYTTLDFIDGSPVHRGVAVADVIPCNEQSGKGKYKIPCGHTVMALFGDVLDKVTHYGQPSSGTYTEVSLGTIITAPNGTTAYKDITFGYIDAQSESDPGNTSKATLYVPIVDTSTNDPYLQRTFVQFENGNLNNDFSGGTLGNSGDFGPYRLEEGTTSTRATKSDTNFPQNLDVVHGCFLNSDVLNPDYDNFVYLTDDRGSGVDVPGGANYRYIKKITATGDLTISNVFSDTPLTLNPYQICVNAGVTGSTTQSIYYADAQQDAIMMDGRTSAHKLIGGGSISLSFNQACAWTAVALSNPQGCWKAYDNIVVIANTDANTVLLALNDGFVYCIADSGTSGISTPTRVQCVDFIGAWEFKELTESNTFKLGDIVYSSSQIQTSFYSDKKRVASFELDEDDDFIALDCLRFDNSVPVLTNDATWKGLVFDSEYDFDTHRTTVHQLAKA